MAWREVPRSLLYKSYTRVVLNHRDCVSPDELCGVWCVWSGGVWGVCDVWSGGVHTFVL